METTEPLKDIVVIYHQYCYDGFGAAWAAEKKLGNTASYVPCLERNVYPQGIENKEVFIVDFCFSEEVMREIQKRNKSLIVIDHHISNKDLIESIPGHVFSLEKAGSKLAWEYFHPNVKVPELIEYISDGDIWAHSLPDCREIESYIHTHELTFKDFNSADKSLSSNRDEVIRIGRILSKQFDKHVSDHINKAVLVSFEGFEVYACNAPSFLRSELGHQLALKKGPFSIVYRFENDDLRVSLRGDGTIDVSKIAEKYNGGGHHSAAAITLKNQNPLPFVKVLGK